MLQFYLNEGEGPEWF